MSQVYRVPLVLTPQAEGGYTVTSPALPGLVTEGDSLEEALTNVEDALRATLELYEDTGRPVPGDLMHDPAAASSPTIARADTSIDARGSGEGKIHGSRPCA